jgi:hypothetical protein
VDPLNDILTLVVDVFGFPAVYTPGSDVAAGSTLGEFIWGRLGNDTLLAYQPLGKNVGSDQLDLLVGDFEFPQLLEQIPEGRKWADTFILGDWRTPYYASGNPITLGANNFAVIPDFEPEVDSIQLYGSPANYQITDLDFASFITFNRSIDLGFVTIVVPDLVAVVATGGLDLSEQYFKFVGDKPAEPAFPLITQIGSTGNDISDSIAVDLSGNVWVTGSTTGTLTHNSNIGSRDFWIKKYDDNGKLLLTKQLGTPDNEAPFGIATDSDGNVVIVGFAFGDFAGENEGTNGQVWISKFDSSGNLLWLNKVSGNGNGTPSSAFGVEVDSQNNIYLSGVVNVPTPPGSTLPLQTDNFFSKLSTNGDVLIYAQYGNDGVFDYEDSYNVAIDQTGNAYRVGFVTSDWAGEPAKAYDGYLAKNDASGNLEWTVQIATDDVDWVWSVDTDSMGEIVVGGWTLGSLPGTEGSLGSYDGFLAKYNSLGQQLWARHIGTSGDDVVFSHKIDSEDNIYVTGYTNGSFEGASNQGGYDFWVSKLDSSGASIWTQQYGTIENDQSYDLALGHNGDLYLTGITDGSLGESNSGSFDSWVAKINAADGVILDFSGKAVPSSGLQPESLITSIFPAFEDLSPKPLDIVTNASDPGNSPDLIAEPLGIANIATPTSGPMILDPVTDGVSSTVVDQPDLGPATEQANSGSVSVSSSSIDMLLLDAGLSTPSSQAALGNFSGNQPFDQFSRQASQGDMLSLLAPLSPQAI